MIIQDFLRSASRKIKNMHDRTTIQMNKLKHEKYYNNKEIKYDIIKIISNVYSNLMHIRHSNLSFAFN